MPWEMRCFHLGLKLRGGYYPPLRAPGGGVLPPLPPLNTRLCVCVDLKMIFIPMTSEGIINEPVMNSQLFFSSSYILELMVRSRSIFLSFSNTYVCQIVESCTSFIYERSESFIYERKKKTFLFEEVQQKKFIGFFQDHKKLFLQVT